MSASPHAVVRPSRRRAAAAAFAIGAACVVSAAVPAAATSAPAVAPAGPVAPAPLAAPDRTVVFDLSPFTPFAVGGEVLGVGTEQGEVIGARLDVTFVSNETGDWSMGASFAGFPMGGVIGFSSVAEGWSGAGTFTTSIESHALDGLLLVPEGLPFYSWYLTWAGGAPFELPGGGIGVGPMDGHFEVLKLTLTLAPCPFGDPAWPWADLGAALPGSQGAPTLSASGSLCGAEPGELVLTDALPGGLSILVVGLSQLDAPLHGGTLVPAPDILIPGLPIDGAGAHALPFVFPSGVPAGLQFWVQHWIPDTAGPFGFAASNAIRATTP